MTLSIPQIGGLEIEDDFTDFQPVLKTNDSYDPGGCTDCGGSKSTPSRFIAPLEPDAISFPELSVSPSIAESQIIKNNRFGSYIPIVILLVIAWLFNKK